MDTKFRTGILSLAKDSTLEELDICKYCSIGLVEVSCNYFFIVFVKLPNFQFLVVNLITI